MKQANNINIMIIEISATIICLFLLFAQQNSAADFQHENHINASFFKFDIFIKLFSVTYEIASNLI